MDMVRLIAVALLATLLGAGTAWYMLSRTTPAPLPTPQTTQSAAPIPQHTPLTPMDVVAQFGGPLQDTLIQRLRDPIDGATCYVYLPIAVHHSPPVAATGYVEYGANSIGSISCFAAPTPSTPAAPPQP